MGYGYDVSWDHERWDYERLADAGDPPADQKDRFHDWEFPIVQTTARPTRYGWVVLGHDPNDHKKLKIGFGCDIAAFCVIYAHEGVTIEPWVQIGPHSSIASKSTIDNKQGRVVLKRNCRIGAYSMIMPGVTVGENSVIGAYSFITCDVPANVVGFGNPFKTRSDLLKAARGY